MCENNEPDAIDFTLKWPPNFSHKVSDGEFEGFLKLLLVKRFKSHTQSTKFAKYK